MNPCAKPGGKVKLIPSLAAKIIAKCGAGPSSTGTKAEANKFHDDKSLYTGVHGKGGPSTVDNATADLSKITNRAPADVRGRQI